MFCPLWIGQGKWTRLMSLWCGTYNLGNLRNVAPRVSNKWAKSLEEKGTSVPTSWHKLYNLFGCVLGAKLVILYLTTFCHLLLIYKFFKGKSWKITCFFLVSLPLLHVNFWSYFNSMNFMNKLCTTTFFVFVIFLWCSHTGNQNPQAGFLFHWPVSAASTSSFPAMYNVGTGHCRHLQLHPSGGAGEGCEGA